MLEIHRSHPDDQFAIIPNGALRDPNLSYAARGILHELLSHSNGWEANADSLSRLARQRRGDKRGEGRRAIRAAFAELEEQGYIVRRKIHGEGKRWVTVLQVFDTPGHRGTASGTSVTGTSASGTSVSGTSSRSTNLRSTKEEDGSEEHSTSLVDTRAAAADASARDEIDAQLEGHYAAVNRLSEPDLRNWLLTFEQKRPEVFRRCRIKMLAQYKAENPAILKERIGSLAADRLAYKYALLHYAPTPPDKTAWPSWVVRPLTQPARAEEAA